MSPADRFLRLPQLFANDKDLLRRGRWLAVDCRIDIGDEPFFLTIRDGAPVKLDRGPSLMRTTAFAIRAADEAWTAFWRPVPEPGWPDLCALTK